MGLSELKASNTKKAKSSAANTFMRFLETDDVGFDYFKVCIDRDETGKVFVSVMDKFGMYLAFHEGKNGKVLARHSAAQYYRQAKLWLFDLFPLRRPACEAKLLEMGRTLENYCIKREGGGNACTSSDYQDAALLCLMWYLFGRASDFALVHKQNVYIDAGNVFFLRFMRMKPSEEQGISLFPTSDLVTCPLLTIAPALITQDAPSSDLIDNLPPLPVQASLSLSPATPLVDIPDNIEAFTLDEAPSSSVRDNSLTIHSHVNRILECVSKNAGVEGQLSSHFFRRGSAQHANGSAELTARWIFDRGAWNMSTTNKGFSYVFNTSSEDHKVSKVLSGWNPADTVPLLDLSSLDSQMQDRVRSVQVQLFVAFFQLGTNHFNVNQQVLAVLTAYLVRHYPLLKSMNAAGPAVVRFEACTLDSSCSLADLLSWSSHLTAVPPSSGKPESNPNDQAYDKAEERAIIRHQVSVINHLIRHSKRQDPRMDASEAKFLGIKQVVTEKLQETPVVSHSRNVEEYRQSLTSG